MKIQIQTSQQFSVTYVVDADSPEEAWKILIEGNEAECLDQQPGDIIGTRKDAYFETTEGEELTLAPDYSMFSPEGNAAVANMITRMRKVADNDGVFNRETFITAARPIFTEVRRAFPEVGDTAVREVYCPELDRICEEKGWDYDPYEGYF